MAKKTALDLICSPADAAGILGVSEERVLTFCRDGRILARKYGRAWVLLLKSVREFAEIDRPSGPRPK